MGRFEETAERWLWLAMGIMILGVATLLIVWFPFGRETQEPHLSRHRPQHRAEFEDLFQAATQENLNSSKARLESLKASRQRRDPFLNRAESEWVRFVEAVSLNPPRPEGVLEREGERYVMIKGKLLGVGDAIEGFLVEEIGEDYVEFHKEGRPLRVKLYLGRGRP